MTDIDSDADHECTESWRECIESKRRLVKAAIAANPTASSRDLARDLPVEKDTVRRIRKSTSGAPAPASSPSKTTRVRDELAKDPGRTNTAIAAIVGCSEHTVRYVRKSTAKSNVIQLPVNLPTPGEVEYPPAVRDWIQTYKEWPKSTQKLAREAFFATINGVKVNVS